jgi:putative hemolysin
MIHSHHPLRASRRWNGELARLARNLKNLDDLSNCVSSLESDRKGIPVLLKHYLRLGARAVAFNVDPSFSNVVDVLMVLNVNDAPSGFLRRCAPQRREQSGPMPKDSFCENSV